MVSSSRLEPRPLQDCNTLNDRVRRNSKENKEEQTILSELEVPRCIYNMSITTSKGLGDRFQNIYIALLNHSLSIF